MFISIQNLRNSVAIQSRVTRVENYLKSTYGNGSWNPESPFPAEIVLVSNTHDDYQWVLNNSELAAKPYGGVDPSNYSDPEHIINKQGAREWIESCIQGSKEINEPLLQFVAGDSETHTAPTEAPKPVRAPAKPRAVSASATSSVAKGASVKTQITFKEMPAPAAVSDTGGVAQAISKIRTRAKLEEALREFQTSSMVTTLAPITKIEAGAIDIEVPKGKQAFVVVL